jgi:UDP-N-acetylmuramoylalanine--D-glutamate ligase
LRVRLTDLKGRSVAVWGTGRDGRAAVRAIAVQQPSRLLAVDDSAGFLSVSWEDSLATLAPLAGGDHAFPALVTADVVVLTPDVPSDHPWLAEIRSREITVTSGSALWMADHAPHTIAVTGSKVAAALISHLLTSSGRPNVCGGPLLELASAGQYVVELAGAECAELTVSPRVAVVTALAASVDEQLNLLRHDPEMIVVNGADLSLRDAIRGITDVNRFPPIPAGAEDSRFRIESETVFCSDDPLFPRANLRLPGVDGGRDLCVALAVLDGVGIDVVGAKAELAAAVSSFDGAGVDSGEELSGPAA